MQNSASVFLRVIFLLQPKTGYNILSAKPTKVKSMPSFQTLLAFLITASVFAFIPGPSMLYAAARTVAGGRRSGLMAALGIHAGCYVHIVAAAAGLSILFHAVPVLYLAVKLGGAAYLVFLGISMIRTKGNEQTDLPEVAEKSASRAFFESMTVEILNPKTALFFLAFLPQFIDAAAMFPVWVQFLILGTIVNILFSTADLVVVFMAEIILKGLKKSTSAQRWMQRAGGSILVGLGIHVALQRT